MSEEDRSDQEPPMADDAGRLEKESFGGPRFERQGRRAS